MMEGWNKVKLKDVTSKLGDGLHGTPKYDDNGEYYFVNGNNLQEGNIIIKEDTKRISKAEYLKIKKILNDRTILVAINGTLGNVGLYKGEKIALGKSACYFNVNQDVEKQFIRYVIASPLFQMYAQLFATGATIKNLSLKAMRNFAFHLPPLLTQRKIAKILSAYDDLIENNLKRIKLLEEMAQKTYEEWFVFRKIDNELIDDSQIGFQNLEELIADYMNGGWGKEVEVGNYTVPAYVIRGTDMPDISSGSFDKLPLRFHTGSNFKSRELKYGDVIIEMSNGNINNVGRSFYYDRDFNKLIEHPSMCASFCKMLRPKSVELSYIVNSHIKYIYNTNRMLVYKSQAANGINNFRFEDMISDEILSIPKGDLLDKLVATLKPKYELISNVRNQIRLLKEARNILLPRLMTGMIDV